MLLLFTRLTNTLFFILLNTIFWDFFPSKYRNKIIQIRRKYILKNYQNLDYFKNNSFKTNSDDLNSFHFTSKEIIKKNYSKFIFTKKVKYGSKYTSGSSGIPFEIPKWRYSDLLEFLVGERAFYRVIGFHFRPKVLVLRSFSPKPNEPITKYSLIRNWYYFSPYHINVKYLKDFLSYYKSVRPVILKGYPSTIYSLTLLLIENKISLNSPKLIFTSSETFPNEWRKIIKNYWNCPVIDWYGQNERNAIIAQCKYGNYHTNDDYGFIEIDNETNEIISTSLWNNVMPIVRYRTGDIAIKLKKKINCKCGNKGPVQILGVIGRIDDLLIDGNGDRIPPTNFYSLFEKYDINAFQIIQKKNLNIIVNISGWKKIDINTKKIIEYELNSRFKGQTLKINSVKEIQRSTVTNKLKVIKKE